MKLLLGGRYDIYRRETHRRSDRERRPDHRPDHQARRRGVHRRASGSSTSRSRQVDLYGSFANSFKPLTLAQPDGTTLDPETGSQFEFGQRFHMAERSPAAQHRRSTGSCARTWRSAGPATSSCRRARCSRAASRPTSRPSLSSKWRINAAYAFTDAEFLDYEESVGVNLRGNTPTFAPRNTFNVWTAYDWQNGFGVNVGARYFGRTFADNANTFEVDGYGWSTSACAIGAARSNTRSTSTTSPTPNISCRTWTRRRCIPAIRSTCSPRCACI